ncbi:TPA: hypothetical protein ACPJ0H_002725 [Vibrio diabolicus]
MKSIKLYIVFVFLVSGCDYKNESYSESYTSRIIRNVVLDIECVKSSLEKNPEFDVVNKEGNTLITSSSDIDVLLDITNTQLIIVSKYNTQVKQEKNIGIISAVGDRAELSVMEDCNY